MLKKWLSLSLVAALSATLVGNAFAESVEPSSTQSPSLATKEQTYDWGRAKVVGGGFVPGIIYNKAEKDLVYARTDIGGAYRYDAESKSWIQLLDFVGFDEWNMSGVESLATDSVDPDRVYIAAGTYTNDWTDMNGVLLRSTDRGDTWQRTELPFKLGGNMPGRSMGERLSIDPNNNRVLYLGARSGNGLWKSTDYGVTWSKVDSFTAVGNVKDDYNDIAGVAWITFDPNTGSRGHTTQTIYVGVADSEKSIYRSTDGGQTWAPIEGQPTQGFVPHHGVLASDGSLYVTYNEFVGPYSGGKGAVWKLDTKTGKWTDISPTGNTDNPYGGLAVDSKDPNTLMVATMNKWWPDDFIYRSTDGGKTWKSFWTLDYAKDPSRENHFTIDYSLSPWLDWGEKKELPETSPKLGWMIGDLEIDPFDSNKILYGTGATLYGSDNVTALDRDETVKISVKADGIEETAILGLISPPSGAPLLSAMGDIGGFRHADLDKAPEMITNPYLGTSTDIDYAELNPNLVVRVGNAEGKAARMGISTNNGVTWKPASNAWISSDEDKTEGGHAAFSADGKSILWSPVSKAEGEARPMSISTDQGATWKASKGIPEGARVSADRVNGSVFYGFSNGAFYVSRDGGVTFEKTTATGLPVALTSNFKAVPGSEGEIWLAAAKDNKKLDSMYGLFHSVDYGQTFTKLANVEEAATIGLGKAAEGQEHMALYSYAKVEGTYGIFRSDDNGSSWIRINDDQHQYGSANVTITGDSRVYGRVYVGTNGYGIVTGNPAGAEGGNVDPEQESGAGSSTTALPFTDLDGLPQDVQDKLVALRKDGIIDGKVGGIFAPYAGVSRAEFVKMLSGVLSTVSELPEAKESKYADVKAGSWYVGYVAALEKMGVLVPTAQDKFRPSALITEKETNELLASTLKVLKADLDTKDQGLVSYLAEDYSADEVLGVSRGKASVVLYNLQQWLQEKL
ncbi:S-layer homology domain-containing protein [Paenibacillus sp. OK060]|uniref:S-layer homology domain-containing protein n=1 Tax=Paenibacillus sp. OK060 TaxID=1881034 RepID=UPI00210AC6CF|nr:S-layer homology domain-containing protein [Paenibacillus sp. OK060]